jgi:holo-[acyl-carrier protein] synthase
VIGLGIDAVEVDRLQAVLARRPGMAERLFTAGERAYAAEFRNPVPALAARFAAKEAVMKALGVGLGAFAWEDVEVVRQSSGRPEVVLRRRAAELARARGAGHWQLSLTHTDRTAMAVVTATADGTPGDASPPAQEIP